MKTAQSFALALVLTTTAAAPTIAGERLEADGPISRSLAREALRLAARPAPIHQQAGAPTNAVSHRRAHIKHDAKIGAVVGGVAGSVAGLAMGLSSRNNCADSRAGCVAEGVFIVGGGGLVYGAIFGAIVGAVRAP